MKVITAPAPQGVLARADAVVQRLRDAIDARIRAVLPGDDGAIAAMLINGRRDAIAPNVYDALFVSGVGHVLSISGYHVHNVIRGDHEASRVLISPEKSDETT